MSTVRILLALSAFGALVASEAAAADPCTAIPDSGIIPGFLSPGRTFSGPVVDVLDGDSLCIAVGPRRGEDWVEVRLADFYAPELKTSDGKKAKAALAQAALGRSATCVAGHGTYDRIAAQCRIDGQSIADLLRLAGIQQGGNGTRAGHVLPPSLRPQVARSAAGGTTCAEFRARGGVRRGEPGYREEWDGDHDGIACEPRHR